jgi:hypothetical protein
MPSHDEDLALIPEIQTTITYQLSSHPNHNITLLGDFNRDIALIGRQYNTNHIPPTPSDLQWRHFLTNLQLTYIPITTTYSRQGGDNYTHTSLIDGFFLKMDNLTLFHSSTNTEQHLNSDHLLVHLHIPANLLLSRKSQPLPSPTKRLLNPLPMENIATFNNKFFEANSHHIADLTNLLQNATLTDQQWEQACTKLDTLIHCISNTINDTCTTTPLPILTQRTVQQGGYLLRKLQKQWKQQLATYHLTRKAIYLSQHDPT